jgi:predicted dehydrogenase
VAVGLVGAGRRAREVYAPALEACSEVEFSGVWARTPEPVRQVAERHGTAPCRSFEELIDSCEAVVLAVPPPVQQEYGTLAARHHRALLLEQPIGGDIVGAEELTALAAREHVPTMVALTWRFTADVRRFLDRDARAVEPVGGNARLLTSAQARQAASPTWRRARGMLREHGADLFDLLEAALGPIVGLHAHGDTRGWTGLSLDHQVGRFSEASLYAGRLRGPDVAFVEVTGPHGTADVEALGSVGPEAHQRMVAEFAQAVTERRSHRLDIQHGLHLQRVVESAETDLLLHG